MMMVILKRVISGKEDIQSPRRETLERGAEMRNKRREDNLVIHID